MFKTKLLLYYYFFYFINCSLLAQHNYKFEQLTIENGLSQNTVRCILQDQKGFIWIGTADGLNRYDGYDFHIYKNDPSDTNSISNNSITTIIESFDGDLLIGTEGGGLNIYNRQSDSFRHFIHDSSNPKSLRGNTIFTILEDKNKRVWLGTDKGSLDLLLDKEKGIFKSYSNKLEKDKNQTSNEIWKIVNTQDGNIWVGTIKTGLFKFNPETGKFTSISIESKNNNINIRSLLEDDNGNLWVGTEGKGLFRIKDDKIKRFSQSNKKDYSLSSNFIWELYQDRNRNIWIGSDGGGLNLLDQKSEKITFFKKKSFDPNSISSNTIRSVYQDVSGNLWVGTYAGGINKINFTINQFEHFKHWDNISNSLSHNSVISISESTKGGMWIGTDGGGLNYFDSFTNTFLHYNKANGLSDNVILSVTEDKNGIVWAGGYTGGLIRLNPKNNQIKIFKHNNYNPTSLGGNSIWAILEDSKGNIWVGTNNGGLNLLNKNVTSNAFRRFKHIEGDKNSLSNNDIRSIMEDSDGNIWVGTFKGVSIFNPVTQKFTSYHHDEGDSKSLSNNIVIGIFEDSNKQIWLATYGGGLNLFNKKTKTFQSFREKDGLPNDVIYGILEDDNKNIWVSTNKGLSKISNAILNPKNKQFKNFDTDDGLQSRQFNLGAAFKDSNGKMYFGGINGFNAFYPKKIVDNSYIPPIVITEFNLFNKPVNPGTTDSPLSKHISETKSITLNYKQSVFSFDFVALNYSNSEKNNYAYKMENFEEDWNYVGSKRFASYTNLDAGEYIFKVRGSNNDDVWNEKGVAINLTILPPFWETFWFRSLVIIIIIGAFVSWYKVRTRTIKLRNKLLKKLVNEKTSDLQNANKDLLLQKEEILRQNEAISQQSEELQVQRDNLEEINKAVLAKNEEIESLADNLKIVNKEITFKNEKLTDSINYAKNIQNAILPSSKELEKHLSKHFIIFKPKDIVSGDFYWFTFTENKIFIATVDCTGHGVPGAFMSMIGYSLLNRIVNEMKIHDPANVLNILNKTIIKSLKQKDSSNKDGMDLGLCKLEKEKNGQVKITFAGAKSCLYYKNSKSNLIEIIKGDRSSIGGNSNINKEFSNKILTLNNGEIIYLTTDGFIDQNNPERKRFGTPNFLKLINKISELPFENQSKIMLEELKKFQKNAEQRDDITIIGFQL